MKLIFPHRKERWHSVVSIAVNNRKAVRKTRGRIAMLSSFIWSVLLIGRKFRAFIRGKAISRLTSHED